jgi:hypothetical protein
MTIASYGTLPMARSGSVSTPSSEFGDKARNVRFALSTNGMNPFGDLSSLHNTWSVILTIYNYLPGYVRSAGVFY